MHTTFSTPVGDIEVMVSSKGVSSIRFLDYERTMGPPLKPIIDDDSEGNSNNKATEILLDTTVNEILEFLDGKRRKFTVPTDVLGTDFQQSVWEQVANIPFGETSTYGKIAFEVGSPKASRAVGAANGANPIPIIVPCHRVVGSDGKLTGYAYGTDLKKYLLDLEYPRRRRMRSV